MPVDTVKELFFLQNYHGLQEEREIWYYLLRLLGFFEGRVSPLCKALQELNPCSKFLYSRKNGLTHFGLLLVIFATTT